jgi:hypothetical protein
MRLQKMSSFFFLTKPDIARLTRERDISSLIRALRSKDFEIQTSAAKALGTLGKEAMDELIRALRSKNKDIRLGIIEALTIIRDPRAGPSLIGRLTDESSEVRWVAAIALGEIGDPGAVPHLLTSLKDPDKYVRYGAASALTSIGWKPRTPEERADYCVGLQDWEGVKEIGPGAVPALSRILDGQDRGVRLQAVSILGEIGSGTAGPVLIRALGDGDGDVRWKAVLAAPKCGISLMHLPRGLSRRPRTRKNPLVAGFLNFMLPGLGYGYLGRWWGIMIFQIDITATVWLFRYEGEGNTYTLLFPVYFLLALHAWYITKKMPEL